MSGNAIESQGIVVAVGATTESVGELATIPEISSISGPGGTAAVVDVSDLASTAKEKRMGLADSGQLTLTLFYIPDNAVHTELRTAYNARTLKQFEITYTDTGASTDVFSGYVLGFTISGGVDSSVTASVTIEISGAITTA
jgi:predicted secreted protein